LIGSRKIKILIVDDQLLIRQGLATLLSVDPELSVVGEATDGTHAYIMVEQTSPDVVLMDLRMPTCDGTTATSRIKARWPEIKILALTTFDDDELVLNVLEAGASGYLLKDTPREQLAQAIKALHNGNMYLGPTIAPKVVSRLQHPPAKADHKALLRLTPRELEILRLIGQGRSNREIAQKLDITEGTVKNHVSKVLTAVGARDRTQAALWAQDNL
jgi:DNA-binding NarL/FixJ family response regulator